jgi:hypothetical protein
MVARVSSVRLFCAHIHAHHASTSVLYAEIVLPSRGHKPVGLQKLFTILYEVYSQALRHALFAMPRGFLALAWKTTERKFALVVLQSDSLPFATSRIP